jgi:hypothetical protein
MPSPPEAIDLPVLPEAWPASLELGMMDSPGGAAAMARTAPFRFRYQYLAGGVNTGNGWANWNPNGSFVTNYVQESLANSITPIFTYYMIYHSTPGSTMEEQKGVITNLQNTATMTAYWNDLKLFFQRAGAFKETVILHMEPDMWGYAQHEAEGDEAATVGAKVSSTGIPELRGLPDNLAGLARGVLALRDAYARNVLVAYHQSGWGTGVDIYVANTNDDSVDSLAERSARFYLSLGADFDVVFSEFSDRDAAFKQHVYGDGGASWWDEADFTRNLRFIAAFVRASQERIVMWQVPFGNTKMRALNNTWGHFQDNRVEWLLDDPTHTHLQAYRQAGVVAFLFGGGASGVTCACDGVQDGVTDPQPINGNSIVSLNSDDDGGFFRQKAATYYLAGPLSLSSPAITRESSAPR